METEVSIYNHEGEEIDAYFYATDDVEYILVESAERAQGELGDDVAYLVAYEFNNHDNMLGRWEYGDIEIF